MIILNCHPLSIPFHAAARAASVWYLKDATDWLPTHINIPLFLSSHFFIFQGEWKLTENPADLTKLHFRSMHLCFLNNIVSFRNRAGHKGVIAFVCSKATRLLYKICRQIRPHFPTFFQWNFLNKGVSSCNRKENLCKWTAVNGMQCIRQNYQMLIRIPIQSKYYSSNNQHHRRQRNHR